MQVYLAAGVSAGRSPTVKSDEDFLSARNCGVGTSSHTAAFRLKTGRHILLSRRFDRRQGPDGIVLRIPYASAMTLLGARDGSSEEYSYTDLAMAMQ